MLYDRFWCGGIAVSFTFKAAEHKELFESLADVMMKKLTKEHELHMIDMLIDCGNHLDIEKKDFAFLSDRVMVVINEDDETFSTEAKQQLIDIMTNPTVVKEESGGHLGALMDIENYAVSVVGFIKERE